jgi:hypothetical protein
MNSWQSFIKLTLCKREALKRFGPLAREDEGPALIHLPLEDCDRLRREVHIMHFTVLGAGFRDRPNSLAKIKLVPDRSGDFLAALAG